MVKDKIIVVSGKKKRAIAKAKIKEGTGKIILNKVNLDNLHNIDKLNIQEVIEITKEILPFNFDIEVKSSGGGVQGQIEASRLAIAKALVAYTKSEKLRKAFLAYDRNMLVADVRRKEPYKPGDSKARSKRQKSYR